MKYLFIAEKPSLMKEVKSCYMNHQSEIQRAVGLIDFVALTGHVCTNYAPNDYEAWNTSWENINYPIIPEKWGVKPIADPNKQKTIAYIQSKINKYDGIIVGTDSDTEGYGIYYLLEQKLRLQTMPTLRFIEHSLTDKEILKSLLTMTDYHKDPVHIRFTQSYLLRSRADWLFGMNATMQMSVKTGQTTTIGRVKAPTIKLIYGNSTAIENFVQQEYYILEADYGNGFRCQLCDENHSVKKFKSIDDIPKDIPLNGFVKERISEEIAVLAPKLYDLASLQSEAGQMFGYSPDYTLQLLQSLYETHKIVTYPRTQCRYISEERAKDLVPLLKCVAAFPELRTYLQGVTKTDIARTVANKSVVNTKEVEKESHDALLPTGKMPELDKMTADEINLCRHIYIRLLAQFLPPLKQEKTTLITEHGSYLFSVKGKINKVLGWRALYGTLKESILPDLNKGDNVRADKMDPVKKLTQPPKRLTQALLIDSMKNIANQIKDETLRKSLADSQGIGTPATRAAIIKEILMRGYVVDKKGLYITEKGRKYIEDLSGIELTNPVFAAKMDYDIKKIQRGEARYDDVYQAMLDQLYQICDQINQKNINFVLNDTGLTCPKCGGSLSIRGKGYKCINEDCDFYLPTYVFGVTLTVKDIEQLVSRKPTHPYILKRKDGTSFRAKLILKADHTIGFSFDSGITCPYCHKDVNANKAGYFCDCGLKVFNPCYGKKLSEADVKTLIETGKLEKKSGFVSKSGKKFSAGLVLEAYNVKIVF